MKNIKALASGAIVAAVALSLTSQARADIYKYTGAGNVTQGVTVTIDGASDNTQAGGIKLFNLTTPNSDITTVCLDVNGNVNSIPTGQLFQTYPFPGFNGLSPKWGNDGANSPGGDVIAASRAIQNAGQLFALYANAADTNEKWAALQLAVWESLYDTGEVAGTPGLSLASGRFSASNNAGAIGTANGELAGLDGSAFVPRAGFILVPIDGLGNPILNLQEFLVGIIPLPEPTTLIAGALLLLPFGASTVRFMRKNRAA